jgi:hypothetical protein
MVHVEVYSGDEKIGCKRIGRRFAEKYVWMTQNRVAKSVTDGQFLFG